MEKVLNSINDYIELFKTLSFSKSYALYAKQFVNGVDCGVNQLDYQEYENLNNQHLYNITEFLQNTEKQNASIIIKNEKWKIIYKFPED